MIQGGHVLHGSDVRQGPPVVIPARGGADPESLEAEAKRSEALRQKYGAQARGLVARSEQEAAQIRSHAQIESSRLLAEAEEKAGRTITAAVEEADSIRANSQTAGWEAGYAQALGEARAGAQEILARLDAIVASAKDVRRSALASAEEGGVQVILAALRVLLAREIDTDEDLVRRLLAVGAEAISATERVTLRVAEGDLATIEAFRPSLQAMIEGLREVRIVTDPTVTPGGVVIETDFGRVDARLEARLAEVERAMRHARLESPMRDPAAGTPAESAPASMGA